MKRRYTREDYICEEIMYRIKKQSLNESIDTEDILTGYKMIKNGIEAIHSGYSSIPQEYLNHLQSICKSIRTNLDDFFGDIFNKDALKKFSISSITKRQWREKSPSVAFSNIKTEIMEFIDELKELYSPKIIWQDIAVATSLNQLQETLTKALNVIVAAVGKAAGFVGELVIKAVTAALIAFGIDYFGKGLRDFFIIAKDCVIAALKNAGDFIIGPIKSFFESQTFGDAIYDAQYEKQYGKSLIRYTENGVTRMVKPSYVKRKDDERRAAQDASKLSIDRYLKLYQTDDWKQTLARAGVTDYLAEKISWQGVTRGAADPYARDRYGNYVYAMQAKLLLMSYDNQKDKDNKPQQSAPQNNRNGMPRYTNPAETTRVAQPVQRIQVPRR